MRVPASARPLLLAALLLVAGAVSGRATAAPRQGLDPLQTFRAFTDATAAGDRATMWRLLSTTTQRRIGAARFASATAPGLSRTLGSLGRGQYGISVSEQVTPTWWVVAIVGEPPDVSNGGLESIIAYAVPLRLEAGTWRVELAGPVEIRETAPAPGARLSPAADPAQRLGVGARFSAARPLRTAILWLDGRRFASAPAGPAHSRVLSGRTAGPPTIGLHAVVAFAVAGDAAAAAAWPFTVIG